MTQLIPALIDGSPVTTDAEIEVRSSYDNSLIGTVPKCTEAEIDAAVRVAVDRLASGSLPAYERAEILDRVAVKLAERSEEFAALISKEATKPITAARTEATRAIDTIRFSAAAARTFTGETVAMDAAASGTGRLGYVKRVPVGVVAAISPFNFPLNLVCHKIGPAVAAGCPVVLKPASATPLTALHLAHLFESCGLPKGWLNVVTCPGSTATHLIEHPDVAMITFTGSADVGWAIRSSAPRKKVGLELGNNAPVIVEPDADLDRAVERIIAGGYGYSGQTCISVQRVYVHRSILAEFTDSLVAGVEKLPVGDPADAATVVSALINTSATDKISALLEQAEKQGAKVLTGGQRLEHNIISPAVLSDVTQTMKVSSEELFGPVLGVTAYDSFEDALRMSNETRYGLNAGVFTANLEKALDAADALDFGTVMINEVPTFRVDQQPYGGLRDSGNTREGPAYAVEEMTERRTIMIQR